MAVATGFACRRAAGNPRFCARRRARLFSCAGATTQAFPFSCGGLRGARRVSRGRAQYEARVLCPRGGNNTSVPLFVRRASGGRGVFPAGGRNTRRAFFARAGAREGGAEQTAAQGQTGTSRFRHANGGGNRASLVHEVSPANHAATHPRSRSGALDGNLSPSSKRARRGKFFQTRLPFSPDPVADFRNPCGSFGTSGDQGLFKIKRIIRGSENALFCGKRCGKLLKIRESLTHTGFSAVENFLTSVSGRFSFATGTGRSSGGSWSAFFRSVPGRMVPFSSRRMRRDARRSHAVARRVLDFSAGSTARCRSPRALSQSRFSSAAPAGSRRTWGCRTATGAGYAGGIPSVAPDGIPTAQAWMARHRRQGGGCAQ